MDEAESSSEDGDNKVEMVRLCDQKGEVLDGSGGTPGGKEMFSNFMCASVAEGSATERDGMWTDFPRYLRTVIGVLSLLYGKEMEVWAWHGDTPCLCLP